MSARSCSRRQRPRADRHAFTLVELLVAIAVLVMLVLMVAQIVQSGNLLISGGRKHLSADAQAREVFSAFDMDLARMPKRRGLDAVFSSSNNALFFYSEAPGFYASSSASDHNTLSLVGYRVNTNSQLDRLGKGLGWTNSLFLTYGTNPPASNSAAIAGSTIDGAWSGVIGSAPGYGNGSDSDYHLLAEGVFRIFYCFQKQDGTRSLTLGTNALQGRFQDATGIILTLAVLDVDSRKLVGDMTKVASALPTPSASDLTAGTLPAQIWQNAINSVPQFAASASIPEATAARIRIYQRTFPLPAP